MASIPWTEVRAVDNKFIVSYNTDFKIYSLNLSRFKPRIRVFLERKKYVCITSRTKW